MQGIPARWAPELGTTTRATAPDEDRYNLYLFLKGAQALVGGFSQQKLPITVEMLVEMHTFLDMTDEDDTTMWAQMCLAFYAFLRKGEITQAAGGRHDPNIHPSIRDITFLNAHRRDGDRDWPTRCGLPNRPCYEHRSP